MPPPSNPRNSRSNYTPPVRKPRPTTTPKINLPTTPTTPKINLPTTTPTTTPKINLSTSTEPKLTLPTYSTGGGFTSNQRYQSTANNNNYSQEDNFF